MSSHARVLLIIASIATPVIAQIVSDTIVGCVTDATGAVVPKASITATNERTGVARTTAADEFGYFALPQLPPGDYRVTATAEGFKKHEDSGIVLPVSQTVRVDMKLEVGTVNQEVQVVARAAQIES